LSTSFNKCNLLKGYYVLRRGEKMKKLFGGYSFWTIYFLTWVAGAIFVFWSIYHMPRFSQHRLELIEKVYHELFEE